MFWHKHYNSGKPVEVFQVSPPNKGAVELLSMLQDGVSQLQTNVQIGTISLLKLRALFLSIPQVCFLACISLPLALFTLFSREHAQNVACV